MEVYRIFKKKELTVDSLKAVMLALLIIIIGSFGIARGTVWIIVGDGILETAKVYKSISKFLPIDTLGLLFFIGGVFTIVAALSRGSFSYWNLIVGGAISTFCGSLMYMISTIDGANVYTPISVGIILSANIVFVLMGGLLLWIEKRNRRL